jgi:hypothetical protein
MDTLWRKLFWRVVFTVHESISDRALVLADGLETSRFAYPTSGAKCALSLAPGSPTHRGMKRDDKTRTGAPGSPRRTWAENDLFQMPSPDRSPELAGTRNGFLCQREKKQLWGFVPSFSAHVR